MSFGAQCFPASFGLLGGAAQVPTVVLPPVFIARLDRDVGLQYYEGAMDPAEHSGLSIVPTRGSGLKTLTLGTNLQKEPHEQDSN